MAIVRDYVRPLPAPPTTEPAHEPHDPVPRRSLLSQAELLQQAERLAGADEVSLRGVRTILTALTEFEGQTWQQRWENADCQDPGNDWKDQLGSPWKGIRLNRARFESANGIADLIALDVIRPSYTWLRNARPRFHRIRENRNPEFFARMKEHGSGLDVRQSNVGNGLTVMTKVLAHTGLSVNDLRPEHLLDYREYQLERKQKPDGLTYVWSMLKDLGVFDSSIPGLLQLVAVKRPGVEEMVDSYGIQSQPVRDMLVRYLKTREISVDYSTLRWMVYELVKNFWLDVEAHNPGANSLRLSFEEGRAWLSRFMQGSITTKHRTLFMVRGLYLDIAAWATDDAYWAEWAAPPFLTREDTAGANKNKRRTQARIHQRIRDLSPILPRLLESTDKELKDAQAILAAAMAVEQGQEFEHQGVTYRRREMSRSRKSWPRGSGRVWVTGGEFERRVDLTQREESCFWSWALTNTLNETGVRIEELVEITTHAFSIYRLPDTGEALPLLQIVPSKTDRERILLISPELAHVFAQVKRRVSTPDGRVPLAVRYDSAERTYSQPLPHLFQLRCGSERRTMSPEWARIAIKDAINRSGLRDENGDEYKFTPHDFRRLFATSALAAGLPIHILAKLMGHQNISTTQGYAAVHDEDTHRHFRGFLDRRRALRPAEDYLEPTEAEINEFHEHFKKRKVELGSCGRAYKTPCIHEHACIRCPVLRPDPAQRPRLKELIEALEDRKMEAEQRGWLGELEGIDISLNAAREKLARMARQVSLGVPSFPSGPKD
ncbi:site-specific integrase [Paenarthrobacter sp. MSM-2-10-13]|uniref:tyrosine-type recombinase/integrase n=1 Tax=Paenarthrobacter sp. MSM-2-10-13 TaxID=2717318 RepID=UPI001422322B|nr:site-specific integrase [Paenarthrobacter sp. MSM-2-10-13]NHW48711.1 site-specific integrase [Paenarthrobacter sp. MSM-2-10-13]